MRLRGRRRISFIPTCLPPPVAALRGLWRYRPPITIGLVLCELLGDFVEVTRHSIQNFIAAFLSDGDEFCSSSVAGRSFVPMNLAVAVALLFFSSDLNALLTTSTRRSAT